MPTSIDDRLTKHVDSARTAVSRVRSVWDEEPVSPGVTCDPRCLTHGSSATPRTASPRVLFVDDDPDIHSTMAIRFAAYDLEIDHAYHGMQGILEALKNTPDAIVMDLAMPYGNGQYALDCIKANAQTASIPVIVVTGMRDARLKSQSLRSGAEAVLSKPVAFDDLKHALSRYVDLQPRNEDEELA